MHQRRPSRREVMDRRRSLRILLGGEDTSSSSGEEEDDENRMQVEVLQGHEEEAWLQASIWKRKEAGREGGLGGLPAVRWTNIADALSVAPLYLWPTPIKNKTRGILRRMHGRMLRQLLRLTQAVGDDQGTAKVLLCLHRCRSEEGLMTVDVEALQATAALLLSSMLTQRKRGGGGQVELLPVLPVKEGETALSRDAWASKCVMLLRQLLAAKVKRAIPPFYKQQYRKTHLALGSDLRCHVFHRLVSVLVQCGYLSYAVEVLRDASQPPFKDQPLLITASPVLAALQALHQVVLDEEEDEDEDQGEDLTAHDLLMRLAGDPVGCVAAIRRRQQAEEEEEEGDEQDDDEEEDEEGQRRSSFNRRASQGRAVSASGHGAVQSLTRAVSESLALDPTHTSTLALHAALVGTDTTARAGGEEEMEVEEEDQAIRKGIQVLLQHCRRCPTNIPARALCVRWLVRHAGLLSSLTLRHLCTWLRLDPSSDEALSLLLLAHRTRLLRRYSTPPSSSQQVGRRPSRALVIRSLLVRLLALLPLASARGRPTPSVLRLLRLLANYLGPLPSNDKLHRDLLLLDWSSASACTHALAGHYTAWHPALRGHEALATPDLFASLLVRQQQQARVRAFHVDPRKYDVMMGLKIKRRRRRRRTAAPEDDDEEEQQQQQQEEAEQGLVEEEVEEGSTWPRVWHKEDERLWCSIKYSGAWWGQPEEQDDEEEEEEEAAAGGEGKEEEDEEWDEDEEGEVEEEEARRVRRLARGEEEGEMRGLVGHEEAALAVLAYKAVVAAHFMGPHNRYTVMAVRALYDRHHSPPPPGGRVVQEDASSPSLPCSLLWMLQNKYRFDVPALLRLSDAYLWAWGLVDQAPAIRADRPGDVDVSEAQTGYQAPLLPPRVIPTPLALGDPRARYPPRVWPVPQPPQPVQEWDALRRMVYLAEHKVDRRRVVKKMKKRRRRKPRQQVQPSEEDDTINKTTATMEQEDDEEEEEEEEEDEEQEEEQEGGGGSSSSSSGSESSSSSGSESGEGSNSSSSGESEGEGSEGSSGS